MRSTIGSPTKEHQRRFQLMQHFGCVACYLEGRPGNPADVHHLLSGGRRIGHDASIALCCWHHRGVHSMLSDRHAADIMGPSLAKEPRKFQHRYGHDAVLLKLQNELLAEAEKTVVSRIGG